MEHLKEKGFSLVSVMVAAGLVGGLAVAVMHLMQNMNQANTFAKSLQDQLELKTEVRNIVDDPGHCRLSLEGLTFNNADVDEPNSDEGLDVELWLGDQARTNRTVKKFTGVTTDPKSTYGKIKIKSIKLTTLGNMGSNYSDSGGLEHLENAQLDIKIVKNKREMLIRPPISLKVSLVTDASGESTIKGCELGPIATPSGFTDMKVVKAGNGHTTPCCSTAQPSCPVDYTELGSWFTNQSGGSCGYCAYFKLCGK